MAGQRNRAQNQQIRLVPNDMFATIPKYSGSVDEDFPAFVRKFDEVTKAMGTPIDKKINYLPLCLEEYAYSTLRSLPLHVRESYDRTIAALNRKFMQPNHYTTGQLMSRVQLPKESVSTYAHALRMLGEQCYPNLDIDTLDDILRGIFLNGVNHRYKIYLALNTPETHDDAITAVQKIDMQLGSGVSVPHTGFALASIDQPVQMSILRNEVEAKMAIQVHSGGCSGAGSDGSES